MANQDVVKLKTVCVDVASPAWSVISPLLIHILMILLALSKRFHNESRFHFLIIDIRLSKGLTTDIASSRLISMADKTCEPLNHSTTWSRTHMFSHRAKINTKKMFHGKRNQPRKGNAGATTITKERKANVIWDTMLAETSMDVVESFISRTFLYFLRLSAIFQSTLSNKIIDGNKTPRTILCSWSN